MAPAPYQPKGYPPIPEIRRVGVIGAGQMGSGIVQVAAVAGLEVRLLDIDPEAIERASAAIEARVARQVAKSAMSETQKAKK